MNRHEFICLQLAPSEHMQAGSEQDTAALLDHARTEAERAFWNSPKCYPEVAERLAGVRPDSVGQQERNIEFRLVTSLGGVRRFIVKADVVESKDAERRERPRSEANRRLSFVQSWETSRWHAPRHFWAWFINNKHELYNELPNHSVDERNNRWSIILLFLGSVLFWLRRVNIFETAKHWFPAISGLNQTPAWIADCYILSSWIFLTSIAAGCHWGGIVREHVPGWTWLLFGWWIIQCIQTSVYHELWRTLRKSSISSEHFVHSRLRNAVIGFGNVAVVTVLFGMIYFFSESFVITSPSCANYAPDILNAIYFSYTVAWSVGPVGLTAELTALGKAVVMLQAATTLLLVGVLLSLVVSGIEPLKESPSDK
jgi:hypothetical protein